MNKLLRITALGLILFSNIVFASCQKKVFKVIMDNKNPVEYNYNISIDNLHHVISEQLKVNRMILWDSKHGIMVIDEVSKLFSKKENLSDFCLESIYYLGKSKTYLDKNRDSLDYKAWFYLHLESIDKDHTKVKITTIEPKVVVGKELLPAPPNFVRRDKTVAVEPSTIEEYKILLKIGNLVGEKDMPSLILPNEKNKVEDVKH